MPCARADRPEGPMRSTRRSASTRTSASPKAIGSRKPLVPPFDVVAAQHDGRRPDVAAPGRHRADADGRVVGLLDDGLQLRRAAAGLSPVTWQDGWPYFGLPGNLGRTPRTWVKPNTGSSSPPSAPYAAQRRLLRAEARERLAVEPRARGRELVAVRAARLPAAALAARDRLLAGARNTLTQRAIGPVSEPTAVLDASGMKPGDVAGLALLNLPYAWIGVRREDDGLVLEQFDQLTGETAARAASRARGSGCARTATS